MLIAILGYISCFVPNNHCLIANGKIVASEKSLHYIERNDCMYLYDIDCDCLFSSIFVHIRIKNTCK